MSRIEQSEIVLNIMTQFLYTSFADEIEDRVEEKIAVDIDW